MKKSKFRKAVLAQLEYQSKLLAKMCEGQNVDIASIVPPPDTPPEEDDPD